MSDDKEQKEPEAPEEAPTPSDEKSDESGVPTPSDEKSEDVGKKPKEEKPEEKPVEEKKEEEELKKAPEEEPKVVDKVEEKIEVPAKFKRLVDEIEKMSIKDLAELVKILEKKFGVSPMIAAPAAAGVPTNSGGTAEEKSEFSIELKDAGGEKIQVIKVVREITGKGLKEAKDLVDGAPKILKENVKKEEAEEIKDKLEKAGATVELK